MKTIYIAAGCFWGVQEYYKRLKGVIETEVGYANGDSANPKYEDLKRHTASHAETVKVVYDEKSIALKKILEHFLRIADPYSVDRQGGDVGHQYRTGVYYIDKADGQKIKEYFSVISNSEKFAVELLPLRNFYTAEEYHQNYLTANPHGYCHIDFSLIKPNEKK